MICRHDDVTARTELQNFQAHLAKKDMSIGTPSQGGFAVPSSSPAISRGWYTHFCLCEYLVRVDQINSSAFKMSVNTRRAGDLVLQGGARSDQTTPEPPEVCTKPTPSLVIAFRPAYSGGSPSG